MRRARPQPFCNRQSLPPNRCADHQQPLWPPRWQIAPFSLLPRLLNPLARHHPLP